LTEFCAFSSDDEVAHHGDLAAASESEPRHRRDRWFPAALEPRPIAEEVPVIDVDKALGRHFLDIGPRRKGPVRAREDDGPDHWIGLERVELGVQLQDQLTVQRVERLGSVETDEPDFVPGFNQNALVSHGRVSGSS
jgi:hypothetical protein